LYYVCQINTVQFTVVTTLLQRTTSQGGQLSISLSPAGVNSVVVFFIFYATLDI